MRGHTVFAGTATVLVLVAMVAGIIVIGPPWEARDRRLDERRLSDLQAISAAVEEHFRTHGSLPESLETLEMQSPRTMLPLEDPVSGQPYGYRINDPWSYELCAGFDADSDSSRIVPPFWAHGAGPHCFGLEIPPRERHPPEVGGQAPSIPR